MDYIFILQTLKNLLKVLSVFLCLFWSLFLFFFNSDFFTYLQKDIYQDFDKIWPHLSFFKKEKIFCNIFLVLNLDPENFYHCFFFLIFFIFLLLILFSILAYFNKIFLFILSWYLSNVLTSFCLLFKHFYFMASVPLSFKDTITLCIIKEKLLARYAKSKIEITDKELDLEITFINEKISLEKNPTPEWLDDLINSLVLSKEEALKIAKLLAEQETWSFDSLYSSVETLKQLVLTYPTLSITIAATFITLGIYCSGYGSSLLSLPNIIHKFLWGDCLPPDYEYVQTINYLEHQVNLIRYEQMQQEAYLEAIAGGLPEYMTEYNEKLHYATVLMRSQNRNYDSLQARIEKLEQFLNSIGKG